MRPCLLLLFMVLTGTACKKESNNSVPPAGTSNPLKTHLDSLVHTTFQAYRSKAVTAGFSLAVIQGNQTATYHYGETQKGNRQLPNDQTRYEIGSLTKTMTAAAVILWCRRNNISWDSPVAPYLPAPLATHLTKNGAAVSFRQILSHTSGIRPLPEGFPISLDPYQGLDSTYVLNYLRDHEVLVQTPGTLPTTLTEAANAYSNLAYALPGIILERQSGRALQAVLNEAIFSRLGMTATSFSAIENVPNRAFPHNALGNASYWHLSGFASAGGLNSNLSDMARYVQAQLSPNATDSLGYALIQSQMPQVTIGGEDVYGAAWEYYYTPGKRRITAKSGGTGGFTAFIFFDRNTQKGLVGLFNNSSDNKAYEPMFQLVDTLMN